MLYAHISIYRILCKAIHITPNEVFCVIWFLEIQCLQMCESLLVILWKMSPVEWWLIFLHLWWCDLYKYFPDTILLFINCLLYLHSIFWIRNLKTYGELHTIARQQLSSMKYYSLTPFSILSCILSTDMKRVIEKGQNEHNLSLNPLSSSAFTYPSILELSLNVEAFTNIKQLPYFTTKKLCHKYFLSTEMQCFVGNVFIVLMKCYKAWSILTFRNRTSFSVPVNSVLKSSLQSHSLDTTRYPTIQGEHCVSLSCLYCQTKGGKPTSG